MQGNKEIATKDDIVSLSNELTYRRYIMNKDQLRKLFKELSVAEYIALHNISATDETSAIYSGRTYLKELAEKMQFRLDRPLK